MYFEEKLMAKVKVIVNIQDLVKVRMMVMNRHANRNVNFEFQML